MLPAHTTIRFESRHHWMWIAKRLKVFTRQVLLINLGIPVLFFLTLKIEMRMIAGIIILAWAAFWGFRAAGIYLEWRSRYIRLHSDGRLEYEYGMLKREGLSISLRLGSVRYFYNNLLEEYFDCANIILPFENGTLESIPNFRLFWEISQGRL